MSTVEAAPVAEAPEPDEKYTPLYADIRSIGKFLGEHVPSHVPSPSEIAGQLGAVIQYLEHGRSLIDVARDLDHTKQNAHDLVSAVLTQNEPAPDPFANVADNAAQARINQQQARELADLKAQLANLTAALGSAIVDQQAQAATVGDLGPTGNRGDVQPPAPAPLPEPTNPAPAAATAPASSAPTAPSISTFGAPESVVAKPADASAAPSTTSDQEGAA